MFGLMTRGPDSTRGSDEHRAMARRCRMLANGINDRAAIEALLALADEHDAKAALSPPEEMGPELRAE
jgi:hypothetical protein